MSTPHKRTPKQVKMEFHYNTGGELIIVCNQNCGYKHVLFPIDLMFGKPSDYVMRHTFEQLAHSLGHMRHHIKTGITEGVIEDAEQDSPVSTGMQAHSPGPGEDTHILDMPDVQPPS